MGLNEKVLVFEMCWVSRRLALGCPLIPAPGWFHATSLDELSRNRLLGCLCFLPFCGCWGPQWDDDTFFFFFLYEHILSTLKMLLFLLNPVFLMGVKLIHWSGRQVIILGRYGTRIKIFKSGLFYSLYPIFRNTFKVRSHRSPGTWWCRWGCGSG